MLHDENYKRLFASKLMVEHLLRACLPADLLAAADFSELGELSTEYVSDELLKRHGDTVWRVRLGRALGVSADPAGVPIRGGTYIRNYTRPASSPHMTTQARMGSHHPHAPFI